MLSDQSLQLCPTLCGPVDYSLPGSSVHGILQVRILQWVAISFFNGSPPPRNWAHIFCIAGRFFTTVPSTKLLKFMWNSDISDLFFLFWFYFGCFILYWVIQFSSIAQWCLTLRPHGLQHPRLPCPTTTATACSNSWPWSQWCHPITSSSVVSFSSSLQSFPASGFFQEESVLHIRWPKYYSFILRHQSFQWIFRTDFH